MPVLVPVCASKVFLCPLLQVRISKHGLLTTVAYQMGPDASPVYALEGSVAIAGAVITWLQKNLEMIDKPEDVGP